MKTSKHRITFKILAGYITIGILATVFGFLILSEIKTFTKIQGQDITDQNKILKVGSLIADIYKNESLARAAIQLNSSKKFKEYSQENKRLLLTIDSLKYFTKKTSQEFIFDSIKVIINKKLKNITSLKNLKRSYNSDDPISTVINKLSAIDSLLEKDSMDDIIKSPAFINLQARLKFEKYNKIINGYQKDTVILDEKKN
ncbi:hypothetical protein [Polaribacter cellanae]|uniref:Uncharacterized protein n=1 Tax=Polaribacter cellanae TaxID=2818493 RepID=A0A975CNL5_9FLAO|nr:hypothetical protein [Polaribacter cellanae]QTE22387.1 hypothetical protein J3359_16530 [Polaribacter cellanae]